MLNFTMVVQNFSSEYSQCCQSSLIPGAETLFLRAKVNLSLVYFAQFLLLSTKFYLIKNYVVLYTQMNDVHRSY